MLQKFSAGAGQPEDADNSRRVNNMRRYHCLVGHMICESLGYFTPRSALLAVLAHRDREKYPCEWYSHMASCQGQGAFDYDALIEINRSTIERSFRRRRGHTGYMAEYRPARALVDQEIDPEGSTVGMLASWF